ncbi:hypothetical protein BU26DRAFT_521136, partial [Trematosphaeria pertusa]
MAAITSPPPGPFHDNLPTPPASSVATSHHPSPLPQTRKHPLKPGGPKESELITYLDTGLARVQKRVNNRKNNRKMKKETQGDEEGYHTFSEVAKDLEGLVDVVWVSGSPNLQIPYLLGIAAMITDFLPVFGPAPRSTFRLLDKLDAAFSSLLQGRDADTGEPLPGFAHGRTISTTNKVRLKGLVERMRLMVVRKLGGDGLEDAEEMEIDDGDLADDEEQGMVHFEGFEHNEEDDEWEERHIARVFERTLSELGDVLGGTPIGIITD